MTHKSQTLIASLESPGASAGPGPTTRQPARFNGL